ncbi:3118_t:CDS:2, partial [Scutellospora calospora]
ARFGQEHANRAIIKLNGFNTGNGFINGFLGDVSGAIINSLLAKAPPCSLQHQCDKVMDVAHFLGGKKQKDLTKLAQSLIRSEKILQKMVKNQLFVTKDQNTLKLKEYAKNNTLLIVMERILHHLNQNNLFISITSL